MRWIPVFAAVVAAAIARPMAAVPQQPAAADILADFTCGSDRITVRFAGPRAEFSIAGRTYTLTQTRTASGARYETSDQSASFWNNGPTATLIVRGRRYPECVQAAPTLTLPFVARGNEPGWRLDIEGTHMRFTRGAGAAVEAFPLPSAERLPGGRRYTAAADGRPIVVVVRDEPCADSMSGMPHPYRVEIALDATTYRGCGGDPASLLRGAQWLVTRIDGATPVAPARPALTFGADGRISGNSSCNNFTATYALTGEALTIGQAASTRRACPQPQMEQEDTFLRTLIAVRRFEVRTDRTLALMTDDGRSIEARRETERRP